MELTKELLEDRIRILETQKMQMLANVNACGGGILVLRGLLSDLDREEVEEDKTDEEPDSPVKE
jgi:hypothetical protein